MRPPFDPRFTLVALLSVPAIAHAQQAHAPAVEWPGGEHDPAAAIVSADLDDDNDDGVPDSLEQPAPDPIRDDDVVTVQVTAPPRTALRVAVTGSLRMLTPGGTADHLALTVGPTGRASVALFGTAASAANGDASLTVTAGDASTRVAITVVGLNVLHGDNSIVWAHRDAVRISEQITNNDTLPRSAGFWDASPDRENLRAEVWDPGGTALTSVRVESVGTSASVGVAPGGVRGALNDSMAERPAPDAPARSRFLRLVGDEVDLRAPGVAGQTLLVGLRDRIRLRYRRAGAAGEATTEVAVGRPGNEDGPLAARRAHWHIVVMRDRTGGRPLVGGDDGAALRLAREQVSISNEVYLQCMISFGDPATAAIDFADPPQGTLLAISDDDGLHAAGGEVRLRAGGRALGPVRVLPGSSPLATAEVIADALRAAGFSPRVTQNRRTDYGADSSADVTAHDARGRWVEFAGPASGAMTTDPQQSISIGRVDFGDGLDEFNNLNSSSGTLEERTLLKGVTDDDPTSIDLVMINRFTHQTRIGEAFVEGDGSAIVNALIVDRGGVAAQREAWTQSHEAGHIFLNQPWHPDNMGPDRPWLLMDADASLGAVSGPKRLEPEECRRLTAESGVDALPSLLSRFDPARPSPRANEFREWPAADPYPRSPARPAPASPVVHAAPAEADPHARDVGVEFH